MSTSYLKINATQGDIAVRVGNGSGMPVLLLHGNSSSKEVFARQFDSKLYPDVRLIALDLPGHGASDDAEMPRTTYTVPGLADTVLEVLQRLRIPRFAMLGWSLGGHIGLEMLARSCGMAGLMIIGTPPVSPGPFGMLRGFHSQFDLLLAAKRHLTRSEAERFGAICLGSSLDEPSLRRIMRTDYRVRPLIARSMLKGVGADQRRVAQHSPVPLAVVNGSREPFARLEYVAGLSYDNLWDGRCHVLDGLGHAPFLERPDAFNVLFRRFLDDVIREEAVTRLRRIA